MFFIVQLKLAKLPVKDIINFYSWQNIQYHLLSEVSGIISRWCRITKTRKNRCRFLNKFFFSRYIFIILQMQTQIYTPQTLLYSVSEIFFRKVTKSAGRIDTEAACLDQIPNIILYVRRSRDSFAQWLTIFIHA